MTTVTLSKETLIKVNNYLTELIDIFASLNEKPKEYEEKDPWGRPWRNDCEGCKVGTCYSNGGAKVHENSEAVIVDSKKLFDTVKNSKIDELKELIKKGANVNIKNEQGFTPLFYTLNFKVIKILLEAGADYTIKDQKGESNEDFWKYYNHKNILDYLKEMKLFKALESKDTFTKEEVKELFEKIKQA